ncbi:MAG: hypothetical protein ACXVZP_04925 [Gaiellaceae bacterium]
MRAQGKLIVNVVNVRARDDREIESGLQERPEQLADASSIRMSIGDGGAVPIEDRRLEALCEPCLRRVLQGWV